jgi:hypothetical protein
MFLLGISNSRFTQQLAAEFTSESLLLAQPEAPRPKFQQNRHLLARITHLTALIADTQRRTQQPEPVAVVNRLPSTFACVESVTQLVRGRAA